MSIAAQTQPQPGFLSRVKEFVNRLRPCKPVIDLLEQQKQLTHEAVDQLRDLNQTITGYCQRARAPDDKDKAA